MYFGYNFWVLIPKKKIKFGLLVHLGEALGCEREARAMRAVGERFVASALFLQPQSPLPLPLFIIFRRRNIVVVSGQNIFLSL